MNPSLSHLQSTKPRRHEYATESEYLKALGEMPSEALSIEEILKLYHFRKMPRDTREAQWRHYHEEMRAHKKRYDELRPKSKDYEDDDEFKNAFSDWLMDESMSAPNRPGYVRANND